MYHQQGVDESLGAASIAFEQVEHDLDKILIGPPTGNFAIQNSQWWQIRK
jgi:hypothetical protein